MVTANISSAPSRSGSIASWAQRLRESTQQQIGSDTEACDALDQIDQAVSKMVAGQDSVHWKKEIREELWEFRKSFPADAGPEVRETYEKLRNLTLDNTAERLKKGGRIPMGRFTVGPPASDVPNFQAINDNFLRGGQPDQDGLNWLAQAGVKSRVDLRGDDRDNQWSPPAWDPLKTFEVNIPDFGAPTIEMVEKFINLVDTPENQPVFIHCKAGIGRTGVMTACWNIAHGMTADEALRQEGINSYHGNLNQEDFVRDFEKHWVQKAATAIVS